MSFFRFIPSTLVMGILVSIPVFMACKDKETVAPKTGTAPQELTLEQKKQALQQVAPTHTMNSTGNMAVNPPHGQEGHRCDIAVGAPLPTSAGNTSTPVNNGINALPAGGSGNVNPPHGQPGHRCDVKVGDPI